MQKGTRVVLARDVERFPHFIAKQGMTGTVTELSPTEIRVQMDETLPDCEEWNNCIVWSSYIDRDAGNWLDFISDVERIDDELHEYELSEIKSNGQTVYSASHELWNVIEVTLPTEYFGNTEIPKAIRVKLVIP